MESVLREFDTVIFEKATPENVLALVDGTLLLWRLELMGIDAGEKRWERLTESCAKLIGSHGLAWLAEFCMQELLVMIATMYQEAGTRRCKYFNSHSASLPPQVQKAENKAKHTQASVCSRIGCLWA